MESSAKSVKADFETGLEACNFVLWWCVAKFLFCLVFLLYFIDLIIIMKNK